MNKLSKYLLTGAVSISILAGATIGYNSLINWRDRGINEYNKHKKLIGKCMLIASGENSTLDFQEGVNLARDFGYSGAIFLNEKINLFQQPVIGENPRLLIGYEPNPTFGQSRCRDSIEITPKQLENYLISHQKK